MIDIECLARGFERQWMLEEYEYRGRKWTWRELDWELTLYDYGHYTDAYAKGIIFAKAIQEKARCEYLLAHETDPLKREMIKNLIDNYAFNRVEADVYGKNIHMSM